MNLNKESSRHAAARLPETMKMGSSGGILENDSSRDKVDYSMVL
jgi:hypothetical protein